MRVNLWAACAAALVLGTGGAALADGADEPLPDGFCDGCEETGTFMSEVGSEGSAGWSRGADVAVTKAAAHEGGICTSPEHYVDWLCGWQGYPRP